MVPRIHQTQHLKLHSLAVEPFCTAHGRESLYFSMGHRSPFKIAPLDRGYVPQSNTWFLGPPIYITNMIGSAIFRTNNCDRPTDHATPSVTIRHIHAVLPNNVYFFMSKIHQPSILSIYYRTTVCLSVCDVGVLWPNS